MMSSNPDRIKALVVGGSSGIGLATAKTLVDLGYEVTIASRNVEKLQSAKAFLGESTKALEVDVTKEESVADLFAQIGAFHHLVITASNAVIGNFLETDVESAKEFFDCKFWGQYRVVKHAVKRLSGEGTITLFSGAASQKASPGFSAGSVINGAIENLARTLAVELAPIRVNTVSPGVVDTPIWESITCSEEERKMLMTQAAAALPLKRVGKPDEIAHTVRYLIENQFTTGATIYVDGGFLLI